MPVTTPIRVLSPSKRVAIAVAVLAAAMMLAALLYVWVIVPATAGNPVKPINSDTALKIVAASKIYAHSLEARGQPVPPSVPLADLVKPGLLQPQDVSAFEGLEATIMLPTNGTVYVAQTVLMRVHMGDGTDIVLFADGSVQTGRLFHP